MYWDQVENSQSNTGLQAGDNGNYNLGWGPGDTGNVVADFLTGSGIASYQQQTFPWVTDLKYHQWSIYAQDSFQASRQLTLNFGLRLDHMGQWYGPPNGMQVWNQAAFNTDPTAPNAGLLWHKIDPSIPTSGLMSPVFYPEPRVSLAYDVFGSGKSVVRAGWSMFRYPISTEVDNAAGGPEGSFTYTTAGFSGGYAVASTLGPSAIPSAPPQNGATIYAIQQGDNKTPLVTDWNFTWSQAMPGRSVLDVSYIGNKSQNLWIDGTNGNLNNLNNQVPGAFWFPDPNKADASNFGKLLSPAPPPCGTTPDISLYCASNANYNTPLSGNTIYDYAPMPTYQNMFLISNAGYANYNSLQVTWQKSSGPLFFLANYTFSKALGIWDWTSNNGTAGGDTVDPYNIADNYGPLAYDHTHILNFTYSWNTPSPVRSRLLGEAVNGWTIAGYTTYQSGAPIEPNTDGLNTVWPGGLTVPTQNNPTLPDKSIKLPNGLVAVNVNPSTWFGTDSPHALMPEVICDPRKNLAPGYYFNTACFAPPAYGQQGTLVWPYVHGPAYVDSDLSIFKRFNITESKSFELRLQANNFLNHPLPQFGLGNNTDEELDFQQSTPSSQLNSAGQPINIISMSQTNTNANTTGKPLHETGARLITLALKFYF
ncbi:MAG TPA: TonB-dependent receptor [Candidatus Acidoferrum sp.]|nr:TonB-dependent receptor [Candidatus Acidoferrum sp.]